MRNQKRLKAFYNSVKVGQQVVTDGGVHGKLITINDDETYIIETLSGKLKIEKSRISMDLTTSKYRAESKESPKDSKKQTKEIE